MHSYIWSFLDLYFKIIKKKTRKHAAMDKLSNSNFVIQLYKMICVKTQIKHSCKIFYLTSA